MQIIPGLSFKHIVEIFKGNKMQQDLYIVEKYMQNKIWRFLYKQ